MAKYVMTWQVRSGGSAADNEFTLHPVMEIADGVGLSAEAIGFRDSVS